MTTFEETATARAEKLLRHVVGEEQFLRLQHIGYLDIPSRERRGRVYRLDCQGNLSYRDPGESGFNTTLCVQPQENVPRDDQIAMRYLLVTADEDRLLQVANSITFGFVSLVRALHHDFTATHSPGVSTLLTYLVVAFFIGSLYIEGWVIGALLDHPEAGMIVGAALLFLPALVGLILILAGLVELNRAMRTVHDAGQLRYGARV